MTIPFDTALRRENSIPRTQVQIQHHEQQISHSLSRQISHLVHNALTRNHGDISIPPIEPSLYHQPGYDITQRYPVSSNLKPSRLGTMLGIFYFGIFIAVLFQLSRIVYNGHSLLSFQTTFLIICGLWALVRTAIFLVQMDPSFFSLALEWMPATLEFACFALLAMFCSYLLDRGSWKVRSRVWILCLLMAIGAMILSTAALSSVTMDQGFQIRQVMRFHILITGMVYTTMAAVFMFLSYKLNEREKSSTLQPLFAVGVNERRHHTVERMLRISRILVVVCATRGLYDLIVSLGWFPWGLIDGARSNIALHRRAIIVFLSLLVWEIIPFFILLSQFWEIPTQQTADSGSWLWFEERDVFTNAGDEDSLLDPVNVGDDVEMNQGIDPGADRSRLQGRNIEINEMGGMGTPIPVGTPAEMRSSMNMANRHRQYGSLRLSSSNHGDSHDQRLGSQRSSLRKDVMDGVPRINNDSTATA